MSPITDEQIERFKEAFIEESGSAMWKAALSPPPVGAETGEPMATWGNAETVGNLIAQLRTFDPATPVYGAFHADAGDGRKARVRGLTLSRERVSGRLIDTGNEAVPYSVVAWTASDERQDIPDDVRSFVFAILGADTWLEAGSVWESNPEQRKVAHAFFGRGRP